MNNNKDALILSLTLFRHTFGISLWTKSDPTKLEEKASKWKNEKQEPKNKKKKREVPGIVPKTKEVYQEEELAKK